MRDTLKEALHRFRDLLVPPKLATIETDGSDKTEIEAETEIARPEEVVPDLNNHSDPSIIDQEGVSSEPVSPKNGNSEGEENKKKFVITETELKTVDSEVTENEQNSVLNPEG